MKIDPAKLSEYSKEKLVKFYVEARDKLGVLEAIKKEVGKEIVDRIKDDGEVIASYGVSKKKRISFFSDLSPKEKLDRARELGAVMEAVDNGALKKLFDNGVKIPHSITEWPDIREIE